MHTTQEIDPLTRRPLSGYELLTRRRAQARLFQNSPLINPGVKTWGTVIGAYLLHSDEKLLPDVTAYRRAAWSGFSPALPPAPPMMSQDGDDLGELEVLEAWWSKVAAWRAACDLTEANRSLTLSGPCGLGKTRAAVARGMLWSLLNLAAPRDNGRYDCGDGEANVVFVRGIDFARAAVSLARGDRGEERVKLTGVDDIGTLGRKPFLILDDFEAPNWTASSLVELNSVLDERLNRQLTTTITTNGNAEEWLNRNSAHASTCEKILRRIKDLCGPSVKFGEKPSTKPEDAA